MAREPELSIKVKVDPQINPSSLKTSIERQVKQSGEKPQVEIDPNVDGIKGKIEDKLKSVKATAIVTPVVDTEKIKIDIQRQINSISDMPKVTVGVDVNNFSNELSEQLKTQLKEVNQQLSYYLKNLTVNSANISVAVDNLLPARGISKAAQKELKVVREELSAGLEQTKKDLKPFNISDLFDGSSNKTITSLQDIKHSIFDLLEQAKGLEDFFDDNDKLTPEFTAEFSNFKKNAAEIIDIIKVLKTNISSKDISGILDDGFWQIGENTDSFRPLLTFLEKVIKYSGEITSSGDLYDKFFDKITNGSKRGLDALSVLSEKAGQNLDSISERSNEVIENQKAVKAELVSASKELASAINQDQSGYLDASTIEAYGNAIDRVLGNIAQKQEDINAKRQEAINLEKNILSNTALTREGLSHELEEYTKVLNKFDTEKITKLAASLKDTRAAAEQSVPKELVQPVAQPSKKEPTKFAGGGIPGFNEGLKNNKKTEETVIPVKGKVTITDADITVDVKNPVKIPSVAVIDSSAAQISNTDDLKVSADALASANKSLNGIASKTDRYVSNISALGPAFQYVAQEVDNLSHSLENQIIDFDRISEQTNAYIGKAGSILINTSNVAITGEPTTIDGKVILTANDIVPPEEPVDIKGHVELKVSDITPPSEFVELQGTIAKTTMESTAKGKKKKGQDVEKPDVVELAGHVKLEDKDIERPNPVKLNGAVKIKDSDIKVGDIEISKKKFDINGNLILKNAEIVDAVKEAAGEAAKAKKKNKTTENSGGGSEEKSLDFDRKAKEAHLGWLISNIGENRTYLQSAISNKDSNKRSWYAGKIADYEKDFEETTRELIENLTEEEQDWIESLKGKKIDLNDPKQIDELMADKTILWPWEESGSYLNGTLKAANMAGFYNVSETDKAKKRNSYEKEYVELIKQKPALIKAAAEARKQYGEDSDAYKDAVRAKKENEEALRAINPDRQKSNVPRGIVDGGYSNSPAVQSTLADIHKQVQKRRSELLLQKTKDSKDVNDKQTQQAKKILSDAFIEQVRAYADGLKESSKYNDDDVSESAKTARKQMQDAFDSANDKFLELLDVFSGDEIDQLTLKAKKELDSANRIVNRRIANLTDNNNKQNLSVEDRQKALDQIRAAIEKNSNNMDRARKNGSAGSDLYSQFNAKQTIYKALEGAVSSGSGVKDWAKTYFPAKVDDINNVTDALREMRGELTEDQIKLAQVSADKSIERSTNKAATAVANLKSQIHDYLETNKKIQNSELAQPFRDLMNALNSENAPEKIGELQKQFAELRARSKELGLETESLIDKFEKLFGTHLSTMITMAALHKMQDALRLVYQNVVEIDTAVTELRKVSEYTGKSLEEYMGRAAEQAQKLGVSISDYVNSTADWKRLGYSDEDAENLATYSTLLKNVGDNIDDVNTSSSYLISTLQGFGLLADQAEDVVNKIDAVANTQPVTAKDLGEILTRSSAAMSAANNTLEETIALGTAANSVLQDADSVGTMMKSLSMYLRAAKSDAENAGIEVDGMANSVSELRSELKSLTGVDIMLDSKNFKSTYQIMKELSQVWSGLSDVTQANVTEMIGGKRNANAVSAILNNFDVAESAMESAANSANVAWEENEKWLDSIQGRLGQLDASFQVLSQDVLSSDLVKSGVSFLTSVVKLLDKIINLTGALPAGLGIAAFATQLGEPKMTGFMIVPSNTPGGDTEQVPRRYYIIYSRSMREYLVKPTNMVA